MQTKFGFWQFGFTNFFFCNKRGILVVYISDNMWRVISDGCWEGLKTAIAKFHTFAVELFLAPQQRF